MLIKNFKVFAQYDFKISCKDKDIWFIYGKQEGSDWKYLGIVRGAGGEVCLTAKSEFREDSPIVLALKFVWNLKEESDKIKIWHDGICSVCGRTLKDEKSVEIGIGPTCRENLGI